MKNFIKSVFAALLANLICAAAVGVLCLIGFLFTLGTVVGIVGTLAKDDANALPVSEKSFLVLDLDTTISDTPSPLENTLPAFLTDAAPRTGLWDILTALDTAATDTRIHGVFIRGNLSSAQYGSGYAALSEVRRALADFHKTSKKPVVAWLDQPTLRNFYVASAATRLLVHPAADVDVRGLATTMPYFGPALKKYGIGVQATKVGKYKSAIEPFLADKMSDADREQRRQLFENLWGILVEDIAKSRKIPAARVREIANTHGILPAAEALKNQLVDGEAYLDEVIAELAKQGSLDHKTGDTFAQIHIRDYIRNRHKQNDRARLRATQKHALALHNIVAIAYAEGDIVDGTAEENSVGGDTLAARLRKLRLDPDVKALVLRVNSPGGSAFASEVIQREVRQFAASGKPVVISMGHYAASGGYWISASADEIFAERATITGSIGVFGLMLNVQEAAAALGIHFDGVKTARYADIESLARPKDAQELALLQTHTDKIYDDFITLVAKGRKLDPAKVREIAEGRVWSGADARALGLVDTLGGLREAVAAAARRANLKKGEHTVRQYPERRKALDVLFEQLTQQGENPVVGASDLQTPRLAPAAALPALAAIPATATPATTAAALQALRNAPAAAPRSPSTQLLQNLTRMSASLEKFNDRRHVYARLPWWEF